MNEPETDKKMTFELTTTSEEELFDTILKTFSDNPIDLEFRQPDERMKDFIYYAGKPIYGKLLKGSDVVEFVLNDPSEGNRIIGGEIKMYTPNQEEVEYQEVELTPYHLFEDKNSLPLISYTEAELQDAFLVKIDERFELGKTYWLNNHEVVCLRFIGDKALFIETVNEKGSGE